MTGDTDRTARNPAYNYEPPARQATLREPRPASAVGPDLATPWTRARIAIFAAIGVLAILTVVNLHLTVANTKMLSDHKAIRGATGAETTADTAPGRTDVLATTLDDATVNMTRLSKALTDEAKVWSRNHMVEMVEEMSESLAGDLEDGLVQVRASFEEVYTKHAEAGIWEYSFSGTSANNAEFAYWFSIDHGEQSADKNHAGIDDSYHCGNFFVEVEAMQGHCGGGCHSHYYMEKMWFNGYCSNFEITKTATDRDHGGSWSTNRVADGHNSHDHVCHTFNVKHHPGRHSYGGPYWIKVRSSKPLIVLHSHPWGECSFTQTGFMHCDGCINGNAYTVYESHNCTGHRPPPRECKQGTSAHSVAAMNLRTDREDPDFNEAIFDVCNVNGNG